MTSKNIETLSRSDSAPFAGRVSTRSVVGPQTQEPSAMAHEAIYDTVLEIMRGFDPGAILDVPAGEGALAARLIDRGFDVRCCDLYPEIFKLNGTEIRSGDLSGRLDYLDSSFNTIVCVEGLEHIENPQQAIREFDRLLKPNGHLVVSVPNILNIEERLKWLFLGYTSHFKPLSSEYLSRELGAFGERPEIALHINPIGYSELRFTLERSGFRIVKLYRDKAKSNLWLYWPIVALIKLINLMTPGAKRDERWTNDLQSNEVLLGGNTLIVHAEKIGKNA